MMGGKEDRKARAFDFDDTLFNRGIIVRCSGLVAGLLHSRELSSLTLVDIPQLQLNRDRSIPIRGLGEIIPFIVHARRSVYPGVKEELKKITADGTHVWGVTGRPRKREWIDMTEKVLKEAGIRSFFKGVFYTPDGISPAINKASVILALTCSYEYVEFYDDDPRTALFIARLFPDVQVNLVQHGLTGLLVSSRELAQFPNLRKVAVFGKR